ncbi:MAG: ATP-dependent helicase/nuclease subunit [Humisphaera sp.]|nr:ATP-dependent helicase/nuclease subunit [Humisphaera sp.]
MGVRFVIGRAGTGKTRHCFDAIVADMRAAPLDGPPIYWILPKQATFSAERELTTLGGFEAFSRARVLSFELFGEEVLAACGGAAVPEVSAIGRQMLLGFLLRDRQDKLKFFRGVARQPGLAARLDATFAEFERCGKDPAALAELIDQLVPMPGGDSGAGDVEDLEANLLRDKLTDFHLLFKAYRDALGDERVDPHRRLEQVLSCISDFTGLRNASVYIDGFLEFTDRERRMIVALTKSTQNVEITLPMDPQSRTLADVHHLPDELSLFHRTESQYRLLAIALMEGGVVIEKPLLLKEPRRFADSALAAIERTLFAAVIEPQARTESLELVEAPDRRTEVDTVARRIRSLLRAGLRLRDTAVLVREIDDYEELISASFREHDIPYFVDRRRSAGHHPLIQFTRAVFQIARHNWPHDAVMSLIKSGLAGIAPDDADGLENYVLLHRIRGAGWADKQPWNYHRTRATRRDRDDDANDDVVIEAQIEAARMDDLRRHILVGVSPLLSLLRGDAKPTLKQIVVALFELYQTFGVRETLARWIDDADAANDPEQRGEHEQVWAELTKMFDQMIDLLGAQAVDLGDFVEILDVGLERFDLALTPPRIDQVLVGQVERTRTTSPDTVFLLGLSEGKFPKLAREDSVLSDSERRSLRSKNLDVDPDSERRLLDENLLGYIAFTRASRRLIVSRPTAEGDKPINPSTFWSRLLRLFPHNQPTRENRESDAGPGAIGTPRQLVTALMRWARKDIAAADAEQPWATLYQFLVEHKNYDDAIGVMRYKAWRAVGYKNDAHLSNDVAKQLVPGALSASVTRIETFATCPFKHFARFHLGLAVREEEDVTAMDLGNVYHNILERIVERVLTEKTDLCDMKAPAARQMIAEFAAEVGRSLRGELMLSTARNQYLLKRIERTLERVCATQSAVLARGSFRPAFAELVFGMGDDSLPPLHIKTPRGRDVMLRGKIDRVDLARDGAAVAVIDYKTRGGTLDLASVYHGLSLQLLTYLLVLQSSGESLFNKKVTPVAAFYARLLRSLEPIKHPDDAVDVDDPAFDLVKPRGVFDAAYLNQLDESAAAGMTSEVVHCRVNKDGGIGNINASDAAAGDAFAALLRYVERRIGELADRLIAGTIAVMPYRIGLDTPCAHCDYRSVCRFDPAINHYLHLPPMKRGDVLLAVTAPPKEANRGD